MDQMISAPQSAPVDVTMDNFMAEVIEGSKTTPTIVQFWAPWCGPCKAMLPYVEKLAEEYEGKIKVVKLNTQDYQELSASYGIVSIPTFLLVKGGEVQETIIGSQPLQAIKAKIDPHLG